MPGRELFTQAMRIGTVPAEVTAGRAPVCPRVPGELVPSALHAAGRYADNPAGADHGRLTARLRPLRGLKRHRSARILAAGHAFVPNLRRGHCGIVTGVPRRHLLRTTIDDLAIIIRAAKISNDHALTLRAMGQRNSANEGNSASSYTCVSYRPGQAVP